MSFAMQSITTIILVGIFVMNIIAVIGMAYLTKFSFNNENIVLGVKTNIRCIELTNTQLGFTKLSVVLFWLGLGLMLLGGLRSYIAKNPF